MIKSIIKGILKYPIKLINNIYTFFYYKKNTINPEKNIDHMIKVDNKIIVFSPHVDDETIGLGGTLLKYKEEGSQMILVYLTDGGGSTSNLSRKEVVSKRKKEGEQVKKAYGFNKVYFLDEVDGKLDSRDQDLVTKIVDILIKEKPNIIYTPFLLDGHVDHVETTKTLINSLKIWNEEFRNIYMYEVNWPIDPKLINSISLMDQDVYERKGEVYNIFSSQWVMNFSIFRLLDRKKRFLTEESYGAEVFVKINYQKLSEIKKVLENKEFNPEEFRQLSSEYNLLLAFEINKKLKKVYSNYVIETMDKEIYEEQKL